MYRDTEDRFLGWVGGLALLALLLLLGFLAHGADYKILGRDTTSGDVVEFESSIIDDTGKMTIDELTVRTPFPTPIPTATPAPTATRAPTATPVPTVIIDNVAADGVTTHPISSNWAYDHATSTGLHVPLDDTAGNGVTTHSITSNWAFDHAASYDQHPTATPKPNATPQTMNTPLPTPTPIATYVNYAFVTANDTATNVTAAELEQLTDDSMANALHRHSELSASDGIPNPAMRIDASGYVGINKAPDAAIRLDILETASNYTSLQSINTYTAFSSGASMTYFQHNPNTGTPSANIGLFGVGNDNDANNWGNVLRATQKGYTIFGATNSQVAQAVVEIRDQSPTVPLFYVSPYGGSAGDVFLVATTGAVFNEGSNAMNFRVESDIAGDAGVYSMHMNAASGHWAWGVTAASTVKTYSFRANDTVNAAFEIANDGGTTDSVGLAIRSGPAYADMVANETYDAIVFFDGADPTAESMGGIYIWQNNKTPYFFAGSDERLKDKITTRRKPRLRAIQKQRMVDFEWKDSKVKSSGWIAQEMEKEFPNTVSKRHTRFRDAPTTESYYVFAQGALVPDLYRAIQELADLSDSQAETIASQGARLETVEAKVEDQAALIADLQKAVAKLKEVHP